MRALDWLKEKLRPTPGAGHTAQPEQNTPPEPVPELDTPGPPPSSLWRLEQSEEKGRTNYDLISCAAVGVRWVHRETGEIRAPRERTAEIPACLPFAAGGRLYASLQQLTARRTSQADWYRDIYGRAVFCYSEGFPCFDSYDALTEHRRYRWFLLWEDGVLTRVYHSDEGKTVYVTEDVALVERCCLNALRQAGAL